MYLQRRQGGVYYFRMAIPTRLTAAYGRKKDACPWKVRTLARPEKWGKETPPAMPLPVQIERCASCRESTEANISLFPEKLSEGDACLHHKAGPQQKQDGGPKLQAKTPYGSARMKTTCRKSRLRDTYIRRLYNKAPAFSRRGGTRLTWSERGAFHVPLLEEAIPRHACAAAKNRATCAH